MPDVPHDRMMTDEEKALWNAYTKTRGPRELERIMARYEGRIKRLARMVYYCVVWTGADAQCRRLVDVDELENIGRIELAARVKAFEPQRGNQFWTFAGLPVYGKMMDLVRGSCEIGRGSYRVILKLAKARAALWAETGTPPDEAQVRKRAGLSHCQYARAKQRVSVAAWTDFQESAKQGVEDKGAEDFDLLMSRCGEASPNSARFQARAQDAKLLEMEHAEFWAMIFRGLSRVQRAIIIGVYCEGMTMAVVAEHLGLNASRISQLHSQAMVRIRALLKRRGITTANECVLTKD